MISWATVCVVGVAILSGLIVFGARYACNRAHTLLKINRSLTAVDDGSLLEYALLLIQCAVIFPQFRYIFLT